MYPHLSPGTPAHPPKHPSRALRRARLLEKARHLRRLARNDSDLWLAEQYETAANLV